MKYYKIFLNLIIVVFGAGLIFAVIVDTRRTHSKISNLANKPIPTVSLNTPCPASYFPTEKLNYQLTIANVKKPYFTLHLQRFPNKYIFQYRVEDQDFEDVLFCDGQQVRGQLFLNLLAYISEKNKSAPALVQFSLPLLKNNIVYFDRNTEYESATNDYKLIFTNTYFSLISQSITQQNNQYRSDYFLQSMGEHGQKSNMIMSQTLNANLELLSMQVFDPISRLEILKLKHVK